ncbi:MAG: c-type cytochrome biogenesis protein CcmI [Proteobacteria bacterium]|nr:c-type cytochrome biogenesis protein CcmI [Pseudomonadota bacterium]
MNPALTLIIVMLVMTAGVLWLLLRPLLRRAPAATANTDSEEPGRTNVQALRIELMEARRDRDLGLLTNEGLAETERELESRVLKEAHGETVHAAARYPRTVAALAALLPILAIGAYFVTGAPVAVIPDIVHPQAAADSGAGQLEEVFRAAEERLRAQPDDLTGWLLLARAKASVGRFAEAMSAYERALALAPDDANAWADYADAAAGATEGKMDGKPISLAQRALAIDGRNPKALLLKGTWEIQQNRLADAEKTFTLARSVVDADSGFARIADNALADLKSRGVAGASGTTAPAASATPLATVNVEVGTAARKAATAQSAVFLIVRAAGVEHGPPLAAKRLTLDAIAQPVSLAASDAMIGGAGLKEGAEVTVTARLSLNGQPTAQDGDWQSEPTTLRLPGRATLKIDRAVAR